MMSNPPSSLPPQQSRGKAIHRRQNSTPVIAFEAMKVSNNLPPTPHRQSVHRRGLSFDQLQRSPIRRQQGSTVSITNVQQIGQQILREAQQPKLARPGQQHIQTTNLPLSPQCGYFPGSQPQTPYDQMTMNSIMQSSPSMQFAGSPYYTSDMNPMHSPYQGVPMADENSQHYFQQVHAMTPEASAMYDTRRMSQPDLRVQTVMRPHTPQDQIQNAQFPLTPPCTQTTQHIQYSRSLQASPSIHSPYPVPMQRGRSLQGIIEHEESKEEQPQRQRPQSMLVTRISQSFEVADMPHPSTQAPDTVCTPVPEPENSEPLPFFDETGGEEAASSAPKLDNKPVPILTSSNPLPPGSSSPSRPALSPRRMSISDLNLEPGISASIEETNVTLDDIAQYIEGPMPQDNKWVCRYEDCNKRFGRKENIKSHVQTHLGDRQFRCDHCHKCFVRGHDLKRHAKIHTGSKPYPCACGNTFARHDALTRHRQRGMCIGAFEGVIKKVVKRGRPRKHRPEMDDRLDKAGRTRVKNEGQSPTHMDAYTSSASSCGSMSSWGSPPTENMDNLSIRGNSPFDDVALFGGMSNHSIAMSLSNLDNVGFPPDMFSFTPPASPGYSTGNKPSPSHRSLSPTTDLCDIVNIRPATIQSGASISIMDHSPAMTNAQLQSMAMQNSNSQGGHSLPSLSQTSSSPAPHVDAFDFAEMPHQTTMISQSMPQKLDERNDFDNFLDYGVDMSADPFFTNI